MTTDDALKLPFLYKGRRMLVIDNSQRHFLDSSDDYAVIVWDRLLGCAVGFCNYTMGNIVGTVHHGMNELTIRGNDTKELAKNTKSVVDWSLKN